jgi:Domain of unknown function (DUF4290)
VKSKHSIKEPINMAYNTSHEMLIMPEYGRNVQQLVRHAQQISDPVYRQSFCEEILNLIQQLYPQSKNIEDYREKLWRHLFQIAKYDLDAKTPSGIKPLPEDFRVKPDRVPYPTQDNRYRHYGNHVQVLIRKAMVMEPGPIKDGFVNTIGSYMKMAYRTWNREHFVSDEIIKTDLKTLSNGQLTLEDDSRIDGLHNASRSKPPMNPLNKRGDNKSMGAKRDGRDSRDPRDRDNRDPRDRDSRGGDSRDRNNNNRNKPNINNNNNRNNPKRKEFFSIEKG